MGLEAWWTWAGESESPEEAAQKRQRAESAKQRAFEARLHAKGRRVTPALSSGTKQRLKQQREQEREQEEELGDEQAPMAGPSSPTTRTTTTTGHGASPTATPATAVRTHTAAVYGTKPLVARYEHPAIPFKHPDVIPVSKRRPWYELIHVVHGSITRKHVTTSCTHLLRPASGCLPVTRVLLPIAFFFPCSLSCSTCFALNADFEIVLISLSIAR